MATLFLHVGAGKTATTSIQATIPLMRHALLDIGVTAPLDPTQSAAIEYRGRVASGFAFTLAKLLNPGFRYPQTFDEDEAWKWLSITLSLAADRQQDVLFSSEALQFARPERLHRLLSIAQSLLFSIRIIFYVRTAIDYSISEYLQHLKTGFSAYPGSNPPRSLLDYIGSAKIPFGNTLHVYTECFGASSLVIKNFDHEKHDLLNGFFHILNPSLKPVHSPRLQNRSLTRNEQEAMENLLSLDNGRSLCRVLGNQLIKRPSSAPELRSYYIPEEVLSAYIVNNMPILDYVNTFLLGSQAIAIHSPASPVTTKLDDSYVPDWPSTYLSLIEALVTSDIS